MHFFVKSIGFYQLLKLTDFEEPLSRSLKFEYFGAKNYFRILQIKNC